MIQRAQTADLLKGIAVILMIQVHIIELFATSNITESELGRFCMFLGGPLVAPIFVTIFGYFIATSKKSTAQLIVRGVKIFFAGMFLNILLNLNLLLSVYKGLLDIDIIPYLFGVDILQFAGISLIAIALIKRFLNKYMLLSTAILIAFIGNYLPQFVPNNIYLKYLSAYFYGSSYWSYFPLFPWLAYPLIGMTFYQLKEGFNLEKLLQNKLILVVSFIAFMTLTGGYAINTSANLPEFYHHGVIFFMWTITFLLLYSFFIHLVDLKIGQSIVLKYIKWLGKNVTIIYVVQWIIIGNIATSIYKTVASPLLLASSFAGVILLSSLLTLAYNKFVIKK